MRRGRVVVHLVEGTVVMSDEYDMDHTEVQATVERFIQGEGQGSFVLDINGTTWAIFPTRSILYVEVVLA